MSDQQSSDQQSPGLTRRYVLGTGAVLSGSALLTGAVAGQHADNEDGNDDNGTETDEDRTDLGAISCGEVVRAALTEDDATGFRSDLHYHNEYEFEAEEGDYVTISMTAVFAENTEGESDGNDEYGSDDNGEDVNDVNEAENGDQNEPNGPDAPTDETDDDVYEDPPGDPYLYVLGPDESIVAEDDDSGLGLNARLTIPRMPESRTYTIVATSWGSEDVFEYELAIVCGDPFDRVPLACGETITGELTADDPTGFLSDAHAHDAYVFEGAEGEFVDVSMTGLDVPTNDDFDTTVADPVLVLFDPNMGLLASDDDSGGGLNAMITTRLPATGEYTMIATSWDPEMYFAYEITLECRTSVEPEPIDCDETVIGELTPDSESGIRNDFGQHFHDTFSFEGSEGEDVTITMQVGRSATDHDHDFPLGDPYLYLFDPDGNLIAEDDDSADDFGAMIQNRLGADGEYVIVATSYWPAEFFEYNLTLQCL